MTDAADQFWRDLAAGSDCHTADQRSDESMMLRRKLDQGEAFDALVKGLMDRAGLEVLPHRSNTNRFEFDEANVARRPSGRRPT